MNAQSEMKTVTRKSKQRFEMADGSVREIEVAHRRTKDEDDTMKRREQAKAAGDPTANSSAINLPPKKQTDSGDA